jgi:hypothetical protein
MTELGVPANRPNEGLMLIFWLCYSNNRGDTEEPNGK